ncbi:MAG: AI-2E family transporter [Bacilli bacterium]|nr:AI-2E family transporter [Bacilli bacterium]
MLNKRINFGLVNLVLVALLVLICVLTSNFWLWWAKKLFDILMPFVLAFALAYIAYPFLKMLENNGIPKALAITIIIILFLGFIGLIIYLLIPLVYDQIVGLISNIIRFIQYISTEYELDLHYIQSGVSNLNNIVLDLGKFISDSAINIINVSISIFTNSIIAFFTAIYFLADMDKIREKIKILCKRKGKKRYLYIKSLDDEMKNYSVGLSKYILVQLIEYTLVFYLIGHPYFLILGILASFTTIIPYFGGIFTNIIALITALVVSPKLFVLTLIVALVLPNIDGYFWSPRIYGKTNDIHPVLTIFGVFAGGALLGVTGIIIALPVTIILSQTYKFYKDDIENLKTKKVA